jgi:hypothetical protein
MAKEERAVQAPEKPRKIKLSDRIECIVTEEGAQNKANNWKVGQKIKCHPELAKYFVKHKLVKIVE